MKYNMSVADRLIRLIAAIVIGILFYTNVIGGTSGIILMIIALILLVTSIMGVCPLYHLLGIKTGPGHKAG